MAKKYEIENEARNRIMDIIAPVLERELGTDVLQVGVGEYALPILDMEGNEIYIKIAITVPRGNRDGGGSYIAYNGYEAHEEYMADVEFKAQQKREKEAEKARKAAEKERTKAAKKSVKKINSEMRDIFGEKKEDE